MAETDGQDKKHAPSEKQWRDAAERGELPRSNDVAAGAIILVGGAALLLGSNLLRMPVQAFWTSSLVDIRQHGFGRDEALTLFHGGFEAVLLALAVPLGIVLVAAVLVNVAQTQGQVATKALEPKWNKLDVFSGIQQTYLSWTPLVELGKSLAKLAVLGGVVFYALRDRIGELPALAMSTPAEQLRTMGDMAWVMLAYATPVILAIAAADYGYAYYRSYEQLKRTDQQLRDDHKERDGDPQFKARRRQRARQIAMGSMLAAISEADVLVTNPTHYAVALRYRQGEDMAPVVIAKGVDHVALQMRREARKRDIPSVENRRLARALHAQVKVGHAVPEDLYGPVAKVLAVVYKRRARRAAR